MFAAAKMATYFSSYIGSQGKNGVIKVEVKLKESLVGKRLYGMMRNVGALRHRMPRMSIRVAEVDLASFAPCEVSRECQVQLVHVECERSQAIAEVRQSLRGC